MILFRYLCKEILMTVLATTLILMLIFMSTQLVHYLSGAVMGRFDGLVLLKIMALQIPYLLGLLIPLGFYLALLTALGRLYADREMVVLASSGVSDWQLLRWILSLAVIVAVGVALLSFWVSPRVSLLQKQMIDNAQTTPFLSLLMPERFYSINHGQQVFYIQQTGQDANTLQKIFVASQPKSTQKHGTWSVMLAEEGYQQHRHGEPHILINKGTRYQGIPGHNDWRVEQFAQLDWHVQAKASTQPIKPALLPSGKLWQRRHSHPAMEAELQWRLALPLSVILLALVAFPLSKVNPRQGRFAQLLPAVLIYIFYANMMFVSRSWLQSGTIPAWLGLWWLHGLLLLLAFGLLMLKRR